MSARERSRLKITSLPGNLGEAITALDKDEIMKDALGQHIFEHFVHAKRTEWQDYIGTVHSWEVERYLTTF